MNSYIEFSPEMLSLPKPRLRISAFVASVTTDTAHILWQTALPSRHLPRDWRCTYRVCVICVKNFEIFPVRWFMCENLHRWCLFSKLFWIYTVLLRVVMSMKKNVERWIVEHAEGSASGYVRDTAAQFTCDYGWKLPVDSGTGPLPISRYRCNWLSELVLCRLRSFITVYVTQSPSQ